MDKWQGEKPHDFLFVFPFSLLFTKESALLTGKGGPDQCGSVGWASSCKPKGRRFDSLSGHTPGLQVHSLVRAHVTDN